MHRSARASVLAVLAVLLTSGGAVVGASVPGAAPTAEDAPTAAGGPEDGDGTGGPSVTGARADGSTATALTTPRVVGVHPNPTAPDDAGEFVVLDVPRRTNLTGWQLADGETTVGLPNVTVSGRVALSTEPDAVAARTDRRPLALAGRLELANGGERLRLVAEDGESLDAVAYPTAPAGELWTRPRTEPGAGGASGGWRWVPLGATDLPVVESGGGTARLFVLPDAPGEPIEALTSADRRILLAGYTFGSERIAGALRRAVRRGVDVRVLVEGGPVGGITRRQARVLDSLSRNGVRVEVLAGPRARYAFHHAKYAVVDDRALVLTENWKPAGTGGRSSRGWGALVDDRATADALAATFHADAGWRDTTAWRAFRRGRSFARGSVATGSYPRRYEPRTVDLAGVRVLVAPDNAEREVVALLDGADASIRVLQVSTGGRRQPFVRALLRAARRGVDVRLLLGDAWYVREENRRLAAWLNRRARTEGLPLEARLARPRSRFGKVHAKGVVVDGERVVLGSLNWNNHSARENREVALVLEGDAAGAYFARAFDGDWRGGARRVPVGVLVSALAAVGVAVVAGRRVRFDR